MPKVAASERAAFIEKRREEIIGAALRLWSRKGYDATSVEAIARSAGLSKGSFYLYFPTKLALLNAVIRRHSLQLPLEQLVQEIGDAPLEVVIRRLVRTAWDHLRERKHFIRVLLREVPTHVRLAQHFLETVVIPGNRLFAAYLEARLEPERAAELNLLVAGRGLIGMVLAMFLTQEILGGAQLLPIPDEEITETIAEMFMHGVRGASA